MFALMKGFLGGSMAENKQTNKNLSAHAGHAGLISGSGRSPKDEEENGNLLQYSCWDNPMDKRVWWAIVHVVTKSWTQISDWVCMGASS